MEDHSHVASSQQRSNFMINRIQCTHTHARTYNSALLDSDDRVKIDHRPVVALHSSSNACTKIFSPHDNERT
jgi:hypothetical protein